jgi:hypothetical protein
MAVSKAQLFKELLPGLKQLWNGLPANRQALTAGSLISGTPFHQQPQPLPQRALSPTKKGSSRLERAKWDIKKLPWDETGVSAYYRSVPCDMALDKFGWLNPVMNGRPKDFAQMLLNGLPSPCPGKGYCWKELGLMYFTPPVVGRRRSWNRTSAAGLALLKHWNENFPKFRPFFAAYYDPKTENQILLDCVDFTLGRLPSWFEPILEKNKLHEEQAKAEQLTAAMQQSQYLNPLNQQMVGAGLGNQIGQMIGNGQMIGMGGGFNQATIGMQQATAGLMNQNMQALPHRHLLHSKDFGG